MKTFINFLFEQFKKLIGGELACWWQLLPLGK